MVGDEVLDAFRRLKNHLDPHWILGRGNVLATPTHLGRGL
jgi:FAD/FMN-containing dehydrogenase